MKFKIGNTIFGGEKCVVIAEAGVNHLGRMDYAEELIKTAARAGADIVKFQTYKAKKLVVKDAPRFWDWDGEKKPDGTQFDSYARLDSFDKEQYRFLKLLCDKYGVTFMSTPFDNESADMLVEIGMEGFKVASCDITNFPFLSHLANKGLPILLSTGASTIEEIKQAVELIESHGNKNICIMQCTLCYPTDADDANLAAILDIKNNFKGYLLGLSDHTLETVIPAASVLYGVGVIEKHYTFDKTLPDSADHWLSLDENQLAQLVNYTSLLSKSIGHGRKELLDCELPAHRNARRSVVSSELITAGTIISGEMLTEKRPGTGLPPIFKSRIIGRKARVDIPADSLLKIEDFE